jgi:hypothetical protein
MTTKYQIEINEIKRKLNLEKNSWYSEILITIFIGIPIIIFSSLYWVIGNFIYHLFLKPFEKPKTIERIKWNIFQKMDNFKIEKSNAINDFLSVEEKEFLEEDDVYYFKTIPEMKYFENKIFTDFKVIFDNKLFLQRIFITENKSDFKSELISIDTENKIEKIKEFDYYYLTSEKDENTLKIKGKDQLNSEIELEIKKYAC